MSGIRAGSRLDHLRELRARIDAEIEHETALEKVRDQMRRGRDKAAKRAARNAAQAAENARRAEAAREAERRRQEEYAERIRIELAAPADLVRHWARDQGIDVGERGRLPLGLRKQYLDATKDYGRMSVQDRLTLLGITARQLNRWAVDTGHLVAPKPGLPSAYLVDAWEAAHQPKDGAA